jgi:cleavage stimulation factor subunit 3
LLTFAYAEAQEIKKEFADVHATYDKFLTLLRSQLETLELTTTSASTSSSSPTVVPNGSGNSAVTVEAGIQSANSSLNTQASDEKPSKVTELQRLKTEYGVAWIMYMRFGRRSEGVKSLRGIFGKARKDRWVPWEVYEASGMFYSFQFFIQFE